MPMPHRKISTRTAVVLAGLMAAPFAAGPAFAAVGAQVGAQAGAGASTGQTAPGQNAPGQSAPGQNAPSQAMPAPQNVSAARIHQAGKALHQVLAINHSYGAKLSGAKTTAQKQQVVAVAKQKATAAIKQQGLSIQQYNEVLAAAQRNPAVKAQLLAAAGVKAGQ